MEQQPTVIAAETAGHRGQEIENLASAPQNSWTSAVNPGTRAMENKNKTTSGREDIVRALEPHEEWVVKRGQWFLHGSCEESCTACPGLASAHMLRFRMPACVMCVRDKLIPSVCGEEVDGERRERRI